MAKIGLDAIGKVISLAGVAIGLGLQVTEKVNNEKNNKNKANKNDLRSCPICIEGDKGYISIRKKFKYYYVIFKKTGNDSYEQNLYKSSDLKQAEKEFEALIMLHHSQC